MASFTDLSQLLHSEATNFCLNRNAATCNTSIFLLCRVSSLHRKFDVSVIGVGITTVKQACQSLSLAAPLVFLATSRHWRLVSGRYFCNFPIDVQYNSLMENYLTFVVPYVRGWLPQLYLGEFNVFSRVIFVRSVFIDTCFCLYGYVGINQVVRFLLHRRFYA